MSLIIFRDIIPVIPEMKALLMDKKQAFKSQKMDVKCVVFDLTKGSSARYFLVAPNASLNNVIKVAELQPINCGVRRSNYDLGFDYLILFKYNSFPYYIFYLQ
jgi:hypothetical protein